MVHSGYGVRLAWTKVSVHPNYMARHAKGVEPLVLQLQNTLCCSAYLLIFFSRISKNYWFL